MQYQKNVKIVIDKRKLDTLVRLGVSDENLLSVIKTQRFEPTGDSLIDDYLSTLVDIKEFSNWGGNRKNSGRKPKNNQLEKQVENHLDNQLENQDESNLEDKDIDKNKDIDSDKNKDSVLEKKKEKKKEKIDLAFCEGSFLKEPFLEWLDYKREIKDGYKTQRTVEACFRNLQELSGGVLEVAEKIVQQSIANKYKGLFPLKTANKNQQKPALMEQVAAVWDF